VLANVEGKSKNIYVKNRVLYNIQLKIIHIKIDTIDDVGIVWNRRYNKYKKRNLKYII
jgi:hypothetical protein